MSSSQTLSFKPASAAPAWLLVLGLHLLLWLAIRPDFVRHDHEEAQGMELSWIQLQTTPPVKPEEAKKERPLVAPIPVTAPARKQQKPEKPVTSPAPVYVPVVPQQATPSAPAATTEAPAQRNNASASDDFLSAKPVSGESKLDLDALHSSAGKIDRQDPIARMQAQHRRDETLETQLGEKTKKAQKEDCRTAYAGLGLLAVVPLAFSTVTNKGCKW